MQMIHYILRLTAALKRNTLFLLSISALRSGIESSKRRETSWGEWMGLGDRFGSLNWLTDPESGMLATPRGARWATGTSWGPSGPPEHRHSGKAPPR